MTAPPSRFRSHLTLVLLVVLHSFTHAYAVILVPLYLLMKADLQLGGVKAAALVVTVYGVVYNFGSYAAGMLADRLDRRLILGIGLIGNAAAVAGLGLTRNYEFILLLAVAAGLFGTLFHPAANGLVCAHYPKNPGMAIGLLGIGSGIGFFSGPQFSGWRAERATWQWGHISQWQKPCVELGIAGAIFGLLFLLLGAETREPHHATGVKMGRKLSRAVVALSAVLGWRDFAATATISLASIYLQRACGKSVEETGLIVGSMMLLGTVANPLGVFLSPGPRRLPALTLVCIVGGAILATTPLWPVWAVLIPLAGFQTLQLGSYAISDAATLERVSPSVRGRVVGVYLTLAGTLGALSPWFVGFWTDHLGPRAGQTHSYLALFALLGAMMWIAAFSPVIIRRMGDPTGEKPITLSEEIAPQTMEGVV
jgi:MFS family permease